MHEELSTPERAVARIAHDTLVLLVRRPGQLELVRVAVPEAWDGDAFATGLVATYAARDLVDVTVMVVPTTGEPRLLSVVLHP